MRSRRNGHRPVSPLLPAQECDLRAHASSPCGTHRLYSRWGATLCRLGSCGGLLNEPVGSLAIPRASVAITSNYDFNSRQPKVPENEPYRISSAVCSFVSSVNVRAEQRLRCQPILISMQR